MSERSEPPRVDVLDTDEAGMKVIHGGALRTAGFVAGTIVSVGAAAILLRHLGVVDVGRYATVLSLVAIVGGVSDVGLAGDGRLRSAGSRWRASFPGRVFARA